MEESLEEIIKKLAQGIDEYNIPDWISFSAICREMDENNVSEVLGFIPAKYKEAFYSFIEESPETDDEWNKYTVIGGGISSNSKEQIDRKIKYRAGVDLVRRHGKRPKT
ncbi:MAG: hypothetical protein ACRBCI_13770 [Cellvibrionaceae bacterium]